MRKRLPMTGWYNPVMLVQTGIRVAISTVFGQFADRREAIAAANAIEPQRLDDGFIFKADPTTGEFWFDFLADTGDGWDATYAMARLLAEPALNPSEGGEEPDLPRGKILVLGGDQVYPTASPEEYDDRFIGPFEEAYHPEGGAPAWPSKEAPALFAIPGNHDWYDGLAAFMAIFCRRRIAPQGGFGASRPGKVIGGRTTHQTRSYFALKLPGGWWLWATDSQLEGYIDQPQIEYFEHVARKWMDEGSKLILCVGEPNWAYVDTNEPKKKFRSFSYLERLAGSVGKGHQLKLVLTGDAHHYARFEEKDRHYITCGGGGAFLHPTHQLRDREFKWEYPEPGTPYREGEGPYTRHFKIASDSSGTPALYPSRLTSWSLTGGNFLFAIRNWKFPLTLFPIYLLFTWLLHFNARVDGQQSLAAAVGDKSLAEAASVYWHLVFVSPWSLLLILLALGGYRYFADVKHGWGRLAVGAIHALFQAAAVTAITCAVVSWTSHWWTANFLGATDWWTANFGGTALWAPDNLGATLSLLLAAAAAAVASATVFGAYLWVSLAVFRIHWNEAFSSLRIASYKSFLRLRIARDGSLTIFPIGVRRIKSDLEELRGELHLIESPIPIR